MLTVMVVDDDALMLAAICHAIADETLRIDAFTDPREALASCSRRPYDIVLTDQHMPAMDGLALLAQVRELHPTGQRMLISAYREFDQVVRAFNDGLLHQFLIKPWDAPALRRLFHACIRETAAARQAQAPGAARKARVPPPVDPQLTEFHGILARDPRMLQLFEFIRKTASAGGPFHIQGETGTGKELLARSIHLQQHGPDQPFVAVNCANLSETMLESQLFGHRKGAFTGAVADQTGYIEAANGGTLFLDEVTELPLGLQARLLRVLQEREYTRLGDTTPRRVDFTVVSAGQVTLSEAVAAGSFRADLKYRLDVLSLRAPPLRERAADIVPLFRHFLQQAACRLGRDTGLELTPATMEVLRGYHWPGNVRELLNVATYVCAIIDDTEQAVTPAVLPAALLDSGNGARQPAAMAAAPAGKAKPDRERVMAVLAEHKGNKSAAARSLGISRMTLWRYLEQF